MVCKRLWPLPLPLSLLLLLVCLSGRSVLGQMVSEFQVATTYVNITWERFLLWEDVENFTVSLAFDDAQDCDKVVECDSDVCHFSSLEGCGEFPPCYSISLSVSGGNYTTPVQPLITAPEKIANLALRQEEGVEYISWDNPSPQSSHCHDSTDVWISYNGFSNARSYPAAEQNATLPLCVAGSGSVKVWASNGYGRSDGTEGNFTYDSDEHVLVHISSCEPLNCSAGQIVWELMTNCSAGKHIMVLIDASQYTVDMNTTSVVMTDLGVNTFYSTCVLVVSEESRILGGDCIFWEMKKNVVQNLRFDNVTATSVTVRWDPSECPEDNTDPVYWVTKRVGGIDNVTYINQTVFTWYDLDSLTEYEMSVSVFPHTAEYLTVSKNVSTSPAAPTNLQVNVVNTTAVHASWDWEDKDQHVLFNVSWGNDSSNNFLTQSKSCTIDVAGDSVAVDALQVCVAAIATSFGNSTSEEACGEQSPSPAGDNYLVPIVVGCVMGAILLVLAAVGTVILIRKRRNAKKI